MERIRTLLLLLLLAPSSSAQRVGVVLSGGGATAMAHIGVLKALEENGVPIDFIAGSSMGALLGSMYACGYSPAEMDSLFHTDLYRIMAEGGIEPRFVYYFKQDRPDASLINLRFDLDTLIQTSLPTNLRSPALLDFEQMCGFAPAAAAAHYRFDSLFIPFRCVASDITAQRPVVFSEGDLAQAVRASMSYPFYFKPIRVDGHLMMDGGLYNNFPSDVMYQDFFPDLIIGSNVSSNSPPPSEDDLLSQIRAMMQEPTNFSVICENGIIIEPRTDVTLFDFSQPGRAIEDGYRAAMARMPEILAQLQRRADPVALASARSAFRARMPPLVFDQVTIAGLRRSPTHHAMQVVRRAGQPLDAERLKRAYFRLLADHNVAFLHPRATYEPGTGRYSLLLTAKRQKSLEVRFGGMFSSRPINTGMAAMRYNLFSRASIYGEVSSYFGKYYQAAHARVRADLATRQPMYLEPVFTLQRWDYFSSFSTFFDEVRPSFVVMKETWAGLNAGVGLGNKGLLRLDAKLAETRDSYYQTTAFSGRDTSDVTYYDFGTAGAMITRNSLNRKQHPNAGESLSLCVRGFTGYERTVAGSTQAVPGQRFRADREWLTLRARWDQYLLPRGKIRLGLLAEGVYSTMPMFQNYTASIIRAPAFEPTPESRTYFMEQFRAPKYLAGGARAIIAVARERFDLRLEAFVFQPYEPIVRGEGNSATTAPAFSQRYYIGSGSLIYQSPIGPVWFNLSYFDQQREPWAWSLNFGYILFNQRVHE